MEGRRHLLEERERLLPLRERERLLRDRERLLPLRERERSPRGLGERPPSSALATSASFSSSCTADSIVMSTSQGCESVSKTGGLRQSQRRELNRQRQQACSAVMRRQDHARHVHEHSTS